MKKTTTKKNKLTKKTPILKKSEHIFDRDKNETYIPNDESIDDLFDSEGHEEFVHPNHNLPKVKKKK